MRLVALLCAGLLLASCSTPVPPSQTPSAPPPLQQAHAAEVRAQEAWARLDWGAAGAHYEVAGYQYLEQLRADPRNARAAASSENSYMRAYDAFLRGKDMDATRRVLGSCYVALYHYGAGRRCDAFYGMQNFPRRSFPGIPDNYAERDRARAELAARYGRPDPTPPQPTVNAGARNSTQAVPPPATTPVPTARAESRPSAVRGGGQAGRIQPVDSCISISNRSIEPNYARGEDQVYLANRCDFPVIVFGCVDLATAPGSTNPFSCASPQFHGHFGTGTFNTGKRVVTAMALGVGRSGELQLAGYYLPGYKFKNTVLAGSYVACPSKVLRGQPTDANVDGVQYVRFTKAQFNNGTYKAACETYAGPVGEIVIETLR